MRKRSRRAAVVGLGGVLSLLAVLLHSQFFAPKSEGQVVGVLDGDTIQVMHERRAQRLRLHGVDCPELGQPYGRDAKKFTSSLCFRKVVTVSVVDRDRYGRSIADVTLPDGRNLNQ